MRALRFSRSSALFLLFLATGLANGTNSTASSGSKASSTQRESYAPISGRAKSDAVQNYLHLPLGFEANAGQTDSRVKFLSHGHGYSIFLTSTELVLNLLKSPGGGIPDNNTAGAALLNHSVLQISLNDANRTPTIVGLDQLPGKANYFIGNDQRNWRTEIPVYGKVAYRDVYKGIDLLYYGNQSRLEYDFIVKPDADVNAIRLTVDGAERISAESTGQIVLHSTSGSVTLDAPNVYQETAKGRTSVAGGWKLLRDNVLGFDVGAYDHSKSLVIDPVLIYSTFLGGSTGTGIDVATGIAVDSSGEAYVTGYTGSQDFPVTKGVFQPTCGGCTNGGNNNAFISKINATGDALVYSTYLGGNNGDPAFGIALDSTGDAYVVGNTFSANFPVTSNAFQKSCGDPSCSLGDAYVAKVNPTGSALLYASYLGGSGTEWGYAIAVDSAGDAYVTGYTSSPTNFPTVNAFQATCSGGCSSTTDAFVSKVKSDGSALLFSTYLGGSGNEIGYGIAVDSSQNVYVTGNTTSGGGTTNFPTTTGVVQSSCKLGSTGLCSEAFVTKFKSAGNALSYSTFLGGSGELFTASGSFVGDTGYAIAVDSGGDAYVTGNTTSFDFPVTSAAFQRACKINPNTQECSEAFVSKLKPAGDALSFSTYLGGSGFFDPTASNDVVGDAAFGIALDGAGKAYVVGGAASLDFPTTDGTVCTSFDLGTIPKDAFGVQLDSTGSSEMVATCQGGSQLDSASSVALDSAGNAYVAGHTQSADFPVSQSPLQPSLGGTEDAFVAKIGSVVPPSCTTSYTEVGLTITLTATCTGNFVSGNLTQFIGIVWDNNNPQNFTGSGSGGGSMCGTPVNTCSFTATSTSAPLGSPYNVPGIYTGSLTVTDASGTNVNPVFTVSVANLAVSIAPKPSSVTAGTVNLFGASVSGATDTSVTWNVSGTNCSGSACGTLSNVTGSSVMYTAPATAPSGMVTLKATSAADGVTFDSASFTVNPATVNTVPTCVPPTIQVSASTPLMISVTTNCTDPNNDITSTIIDWGDQTTPSSGTSATHVYAAANQYSITVTAMDSAGFTATISESVSFNAQPAPVTPGQTVTGPVNVIAPSGVSSTTVNFSCQSVTSQTGATGPPSMFGMNCTASQNVTLTSTPTSITVTINTTGTGAASRAGINSVPTIFALLLPFPAMIWLVGGTHSLRWKVLSRGRMASITLVLLLLIGIGCGGGSSSSSTQTTSGTPAGVYTATVVGTDSSGVVQATVPFTFTVSGGH